MKYRSRVGDVVLLLFYQQAARHRTTLEVHPTPGAGRVKYRGRDEYVDMSKSSIYNKMKTIIKDKHLPAEVQGENPVHVGG